MAQQMYCALQSRANGLLCLVCLTKIHRVLYCADNTGPFPMMVTGGVSLNRTTQLSYAPIHDVVVAGVGAFRTIPWNIRGLSCVVKDSVMELHWD
jgi:hypothetical protein